MDIIIQLVCMLVSFAYGTVINIGYKFTNKIYNKKDFKLLFLNICFSFNVVVLYIIILYKINGGIFHLYFLILMVIGCFLSNMIVKRLKK